MPKPFPVNFKFKKFKKHLVITITIFNQNLIIAIICGIIVAFFFIYLPFISNIYRQTKTAASTISNQYIPTQIWIPSINLNLPIKEASVSANDWQIFDDAVSWLKTSGDLSKGNIVLYGHNQQTIFGKIIELGIGSKITLKSPKMEKKFIVTQVFESTPQNIDLLQNSDENKLTMYTCSGWFDVNRFFVIAIPVEQN